MPLGRLIVRDQSCLEGGLCRMVFWRIRLQQEHLIQVPKAPGEVPKLPVSCSHVVSGRAWLSDREGCPKFEVRNEACRISGVNVAPKSCEISGINSISGITCVSGITVETEPAV